jgi:uncharacterized membrane protein YcfT
MNEAAASAGRVGWVDFAKGFCIIFVVMMHSTLGVEAAAGSQGWMHYAVQFAKPFRMPDFFLISGLFLALVIDRPWLRYLDRKVVHFFYFYLLWMTIQFALKTPSWIGEGQDLPAIARLYFLSFIDPFGTLWFIYILPVFFVVTRLLKRVPWQATFAVAAVLEVLPIHTGWMMIDEFAARYVYFLAGYLFAANIFALSRWAGENIGKAIAILVLWFVVNGFATFTPAPQMQWAGEGVQYVSDKPVISLALGAAGAIAVVLFTTLLSKLWAARFLGYLGKNSIVVYLAFFLPMAVTRSLLLKFAPFLDIGTVSVLVTVAGVTGPVILYHIVQRTGFGRFLFERPQWAHVDGAKPRKHAMALEPAE